MKNKSYLPISKIVLLGGVLTFCWSDTYADNGVTSSSKPDVTTSEATQQNRTVRGRVVDEQGEPIAGATVRVAENSKQGTITDLDGNFTLNNVQVGHHLVVSLVGSTTRRVEVTKSSAPLRIVLKEDSKLIDEVVVTAFGTGQKKVSVTGSVQTIRPSELKVPAANLSASFAGRLAGVVSVQRSGAPGADGADFWIRGISSTNATSPLIILDGVSISAGDLNSIDPEVIEGFSILKDATATALYGSRGANGVVIIKTKTGADLSKPIINVRVEGYMTTPTKLPKFVDGARYMELYNEAVGNLSTTGANPYSRDRIAGTRAGLDPYQYPNVQWYDELFQNHAFNQKANFNIRGGGKKLNYFMSATADHQSGMLRPRSKEFASFDNSIQVFRYAFQNNITLNLSESSAIALRLNAQIGQSRRPATDVGTIFSQVIDSNPVDFPILYPKDEGLDYERWGAELIGSSIRPNPFVSATNGYRDNFNSTLIANLEFSQKLDKITKGLKFKALASFKNWSSSSTVRQRNSNFFILNRVEDITDPVTGEVKKDYILNRVNTEVNTVLNSGGGTSGDRRLYFESMLLWDRDFGKHSVSAMMNYNQEETATNMTNDKILNNLPRRRQGLAGRVSYSYDNRYLAEANFGFNGSENFAKGHRFGFFPSFALGYNISEEKYWEPLKKYISYLKLRGSYGLVGNDAIGGDRFVYMSNIELTGGTSYRTGVGQNYVLSGPKYNRFANPMITWEVGYKTNLGIDLQAFKGFRLNLDVFQELRTNVFQQRGSVPSYMGTSTTSIVGNLAQIRNKGIDGSVEYNHSFNKDFWVNVKGTFTFARNKIEKWDEPLFNEYPALANVGQRLAMHLGYEAERLFIDDAEAKNSPEQKFNGGASGGDIKYKDQPNYMGEYDGQITPNDRKYIGNPYIPEIIYGFGANTKYHNIDFGIFFQGVDNTSMMIGSFHPFGTQTNRNVLKFIDDDHWSPTNPNIWAAYPRLTQITRDNNIQNSTYWLRDASFLKLKNIELGYTYRNTRLYVSGQNLLTFSKFKLWDPEMGGGNGLKYPTQKTVNVGIQITFK